MHWMSDTSVGSWLDARLDSDGPDWHRTIHAVVPRGFAAYARVLHPAGARWMPGRSMPTFDEWQRLPEREQQRLTDEIVSAPVTWADAAAAFGTTLHPFSVWHRIVRTPDDGDWHTPVSPDGREFWAPDIGQLPPDLLARIAGHLAAQTSTPDAGYAAIWEGFGGLLGHLGHSPSRAFLTVDDDPRHREMLGRSTRDPFNSVFRKPTWQDGILSREISEGPRLHLPNRAYVVFSAAAREFSSADWVLRAPWRDRPAEEHGLEPSAHSPSILWPEDRAWVVVSEIDFDSTIIGGSRELIAAICADEGIEAFEIPEGARFDGEPEMPDA